MEVRDYELDCEQIVNNANYLHYMEHTRHKFCHQVGVPFIEMHRKGLDAVVRKIEIEYFQSLKSGDRFNSCLSLQREGPRFIFHQAIFHTNDELIAKATVIVVLLQNGKLSRGDELAQIFAEYL